MSVGRRHLFVWIFRLFASQRNSLPRAVEGPSGYIRVCVLCGFFWSPPPLIVFRPLLCSMPWSCRFVLVNGRHKQESKEPGEREAGCESCRHTPASHPARGRPHTPHATVTPSHTASRARGWSPKPHPCVRRHRLFGLPTHVSLTSGPSASTLRPNLSRIGLS